MRPDTYDARAKIYTWQPTSPMKTPKKSWCDCTKVLVILGVLNAIILLVAAIIVPIITTGLNASTTTTTTTITTITSLPNQCYNYTLDVDSTRLTTYAVVASGCDTTIYATTIWVRYGGIASTLATSPPQLYRCGTSATGWYTGCLPSTAGSTVTGVVCFAWTSTICDFHSTVSVTNCNGFYVYLIPAPSNCPLRYCTQ